MEHLKRTIAVSSLATLAGVAIHYGAFALGRSPLWTDAIAEWIMARTPSHYAVWILEILGPWAKPFAVTGGLAVLGLAVWLAGAPGWFFRRWDRAATALAACVLAAAIGLLFEYRSWVGQLTFWAPAAAALMLLRRGRPLAESAERRRFLALPIVMGAGTVAVAAEAYLRDRALARRAVEPVELFPFYPPEDRFAGGLVRPAVTPVGQFYTMSKNTVDPAEDPERWRLRITVDGRLACEYRYQELLALPRRHRYVTLRCVSNTLKSNLMGNAFWTGISLAQLVSPASLPQSIVEVAVIGSDGHGDSLPLDYAFAEETMLAFGMNGKTLNRAHGFPLRLLVPRYYGFKHVKWIFEIAFRSEPYFGTWPRMGYTKQPLVHTVSYIDRVARAGEQWQAGGIAFAGNRGIQRVVLRADDGQWRAARLEPPLSPYAWTRWRGEIDAPGASLIEARALDGGGDWQAAEEGPLFPSGVRGPTLRRLP